jgi:hypothetical protein
MVTCIDDHKDRFGVEPICAVLPIARQRTTRTKRSIATRIAAQLGRDEMLS